MSLGDELTKRKLLGSDVVSHAKTTAAIGDTTLPEALIEMGAVSEGDFVSWMHTQLGFPMVDDAYFGKIEAETLALLPASLAVPHRVLPLYKAGGKLFVASIDPLNDALALIASTTHHQVIVCVARPSAVISAINKRYSSQIPLPVARQRGPENVSSVSSTLGIADLMKGIPSVAPTAKPMASTPVALHPTPPAAAQPVAARQVAPTLPPAAPVRREPEPPARAAEPEPTWPPPPGIFQAPVRGAPPRGRGTVTPTPASPSLFDAPMPSPPPPKALPTTSAPAGDDLDAPPLELTRARQFFSASTPDYSETHSATMPDAFALAKAKQELTTADTAEGVATVICQFTTRFFPRVVVLAHRQDMLLGLHTHGTELSSTRLRGLIVPLHASSVFKQVVDSQAYFLGRLKRTMINSAFLSALGDKQHGTALVVPLVVDKRVALVLYADTAGGEPSQPDLSEVYKLCEAGGARLLDLIRKKP